MPSAPMVADGAIPEAVETRLVAVGPPPVREVEDLRAEERLELDDPGEVLPPVLDWTGRLAIWVTPPAAVLVPSERLPRNWGVRSWEAFSAAVTPVRRSVRSRRRAVAVEVGTVGPEVPLVSVDVPSRQESPAPAMTSVAIRMPPHGAGFLGGGGTNTGLRAGSVTGCGEGFGVWLGCIRSY